MPLLISGSESRVFSAVIIIMAPCLISIRVIKRCKTKKSIKATWGERAGTFPDAVLQLTHSEAGAEMCSLTSLLLCAHLVAIKRVKQSTLTRTHTNICSLVSVPLLARRCCESSSSARPLADCSGCGLWIHLCWSWLPGMAACGLVRVCGCCHSSQNCGVYTHAIIHSWLSM